MENKNALAAAMLDMPAVAELDSVNPHKNYKYASADSLYKAVRPALAKHGLTIWFQEIDFKLEPNTGGKLFIHATYELGFQTDPQEPPPEASMERMTMVSPYFDVQSCQAVRTYALKYWLRSKTLIATGEIEDDLDANPPEQEKPKNSPPEEQKPPEMADPEQLQAILDRTDKFVKQGILTAEEGEAMVTWVSRGIKKSKVKETHDRLAAKRNKWMESRSQSEDPPLNE